jgi:hypothetical protein
MASVGKASLPAELASAKPRQVAARPGDVAVGIYQTWDHASMLDVFTRAFKRPGPARDTYKVYKSIEEFADAWHALPNVGPLDPVPLGFYEGGLIHLPPNAQPITMFHETMHWAGEQAGSRAILGRFVEEGMAEKLTLDAFGPAADNVYLENVAFCRRLEEVVGRDVLDQAYLHRQWSPLRSALRQHFGGSELKAEKFYQLLRSIGPEGGPGVGQARFALDQGAKARL